LHSLSLQLKGQTSTMVRDEMTWTIDDESIHIFKAIGEKKNPPVGTQHLVDNSPKNNYLYISSQIQNLILQKHLKYGDATTYLRTTEKDFKIDKDDDLDDSEKQVLATKYFSNAIIPMGPGTDPTLSAQQEICR
jgi:aspartyl/asparaginyl-tRNA synthetase